MVVEKPASRIFRHDRCGLTGFFEKLEYFEIVFFTFFRKEVGCSQTLDFCWEFQATAQMPGKTRKSHFQAPKHGLNNIPSKNTIFSKSLKI